MQSYPSPNAVPADSQPFYASSSSQQQSNLRDADELQSLAALSHNLAPMMTGGPGGNIAEGQEQRAQSQGNSSRPYEHEQDQHPHAGHIPQNHNPMDQMGNQYGQSEGSSAPRKRSKVSRACDECRRKKIRCDATGDPGNEDCSSCKRVQARCQFSRVPMKRGPSKGYIKELADRLNHLEGAMQASEIPVQQYLPHHGESPMQRRPSDEYSPPPHGESARKRTYSSVSGEFNAPYIPQRAQGPWTAPEVPRHLPPPNTFSPPQSNAVFREPNYSPNGIHPIPQWRNPPDIPHRQSVSFENIPEEALREHPLELDDAVFDGYFTAIHSTYPLLWQSKTRTLNKLSSCPPILRDAFVNSLFAAVSSLPGTNSPPSHQQAGLRAAQLITSFQYESISTAPLATSLIHLQTLMLLAIRTGQTKTPGGSSQSVWLGSAVGLAYTLKLHQRKQLEHSGDEDLDSDERLARRIWWALVIMDRCHASSTSSPTLIPDGSVVVFPDDQALLGDSLYTIARLAIVLGHYSSVTLETTNNAPFGTSEKPFYGTLLKGELDRCSESFPASVSSASNAPLVHILYWHLRILVNLKIQDYDPYDLLAPAMRTVAELTHNSGLVSPLTSHCTMLVALALLELTEYDSTREDAEKGLNVLLETAIAPSTWDAAIRDLIARRKKWDATVVAPVAITKLSTTESEQAAVAAQGLQHLADLATSRDIPTGDERKDEEKTSSGPTAARFKRHQPLRELIRDGYLSAFGETGR